MPSRVSTRRTAISAYTLHWPTARPSVLSNTNSTEARPAGLRLPEPLKITSCMDSPRNSEALVSPSTQRTASIIFDLPQPFGPTTPTSWLGTGITVASTKDLKPDNLIWVKRTRNLSRNSDENKIILRFWWNCFHWNSQRPYNNPAKKIKKYRNGLCAIKYVTRIKAIFPYFTLNIVF